MSKYIHYTVLFCAVLPFSCKKREFNAALSTASSAVCSPSNLSVCCPTPYEAQELEGRTSAIICRKANDVLGPFPEEMTKRCVQMADGNSDAQAACKTRIWNFDLVNSLWGRDRCPTNTSWNRTLGACFESSSNSVFGPFPTKIVSKCVDESACADMKWSANSLASLQGINASNTQTSAKKQWSLGPGGRPPQIIAISFDGAGDQKMLKELYETAKSVNAHFTYFLSGVYLLTKQSGNNYNAPRRGLGVSDIGFNYEGDGFTASQYVEELIKEVNRAQAGGHEIGTHYNGHFCGAGGGDSWSAADWRQELSEFNKIVKGAAAFNGISASLKIPAVQGGRTPCLEGNKDILYPELSKSGFRYDASLTAEIGYWPKKKNGLWGFPLVSIPLADGRGPVLSMDYNLCFYENGCRPVSDGESARLQQRTYNSYMNYFNKTFRGNRAPIHIGHHTTKWHRGAYWNALLRFVSDVCGQSEVACVTYRELSDFLDQYSDKIGSFEQGRFARMESVDGAKNITVSEKSCSTDGTARLLSRNDLEACGITQNQSGIDGRIEGSGQSNHGHR